VLIATCFFESVVVVFGFCTLPFLRDYSIFHCSINSYPDFSEEMSPFESHCIHESGDSSKSPRYEVMPKLATAPVLLILSALVAVFLAGGPHQGAVGLFVMLSGVILLVRSPRQVASWVLWGLVIFLVIMCGASLLPFGKIFEWAHSSWRELLQHFPAIALHGTISLSPYDTAGWGVVFLISLMVALYVLGYPLERRELNIAAQVSVSGILLYSILSLVSWKTGWSYPFFVIDPDYPKVFGFFPNRNHSAGFLATGAILSLGLVYSGGRQSFLLRIAALGAFLFLDYCLLFVSVSRGGVIALGLGLAIWILGLGKRYRPWWLLGCLILVVVLVGVRFAGSDSALLERFRAVSTPTGVTLADHEEDRGKHSSGFFSDARIALAKDTLRIIRDYPLTGTGLGTYAAVYPFYASASLMDKTTALHPESDWLMIAAECGLPALIVAGIVLFLLLRRIPVLKSLPDDGWPLRWAFISSFLAETLHGLVDVPLHRLELGWWVMILGGIGFAIPSYKEQNTISLRIQRFLFLIVGLLMVFCGGWMVASQWFGVKDLPPFESINGRDRVLMRYAYADNSMEQLGPVFRECERLIARYPMNSEVPHQYAIFLVQEQRDLPLAERLFERARKLSVFNADLAFFHGKFLIDIDPKETLRSWKEALEFQIRLDSGPKTTFRRAEQLFGTMINESATHPEVMSGLWEIASVSPQLQVAWLQQPTIPVASLERAVNDRTFMERLSRHEQSSLIERWWERAARDRKAVKAFVSSHPEYADAATITQGRILMEEGKPKEACDLLIKEFGVSLDPKISSKDSESLRAVDALEQASAYLKQGNGVFARRYLSEAKDHGASPLECLRIQALLDLQSGNYATAFAVILDYLRMRGDL
jgi:hypothetical protein